jgi:anti-sigma-K factor RskA
MKQLKKRQKELLFDYCIGITSEKETAEFEKLISSNKEAIDIRRKLKEAFAPLESIRPEPCPSVLVERTIFWILRTSYDSSYPLPLSGTEKQPDFQVTL